MSFFNLPFPLATFSYWLAWFVSAYLFTFLLLLTFYLPLLFSPAHLCIYFAYLSTLLFFLSACFSSSLSALLSINPPTSFPPTCFSFPTTCSSFYLSTYFLSHLPAFFICFIFRHLLLFWICLHRYFFCFSVIYLCTFFLLNFRVSLCVLIPIFALLCHLRIVPTKHKRSNIIITKQKF